MIDLTDIQKMIVELTNLGYRVTPESMHKTLRFGRVVDDNEPLVQAKEVFRWEAVHMIAAQLHPGLITYDDELQMSSPVRRILSARLHI